MSSILTRHLSRDAPVARGSCSNCTRSLADRAIFTFGGERRCTRCALRYGPMIKRSALTALVVGTVLVGINQGVILATGDFPLRLIWQIPLTYAVPFCVASWGALSNSRS